MSGGILSPVGLLVQPASLCWVIHLLRFFRVTGEKLAIIDRIAPIDRVTLKGEMIDGLHRVFVFV